MKHTRTRTKSQSKKTRRTRTKKMFENRFATLLKTKTKFYKLKFEPQFELRDDLEWFSEIKGYGKEYGNYLDTYEVIKDMKLLNLGKPNVRKYLMEKFMNIVDDEESLCDAQYSGSAVNKMFHQKISRFIYENGFQGTIVRNIEDVCGPTEIVIYPSQQRSSFLKKIDSEQTLSSKKNIIQEFTSK